MDNYKVIGIMSGTSLDGVDLAYCEFNFDKSWKFQLYHTKTISYANSWKNKLSNLINASKEEIKIANIEYGEYLGLLVQDFIRENKISPDFISSHGHTIFHQPEKKHTLQIGDGQVISNIVKLPVVFDFRSLDVQLGGQGAPLVPIGDKLLFDQYDSCINFGGIANISYDQDGSRIAFDICPFNMVLNYYSKRLGKEFDLDGQFAANGAINLKLLNKLNNIEYYHQSPPKSLGREWVVHHVFPLIEEFRLEPEDVLGTFTEHIINQISKVMPGKGKILITGGGAKNMFLIKQLRSASLSEIIIPDDSIIDYKEALVFAFLGVLRWRNEVNCLATVTGASRDSCGGVIVK
jgi:anhydro-N-acetylmuramic acid kinase